MDTFENNSKAKAGGQTSFPFLPSSGTSKDTIDLSDSLLDAQTARAVTALHNHNAPPVLFRRGTGLCEIVLDDGDRPVIRQLSNASLCRRLAEVCTFVASGRHGLKAKNPPASVVANVLAQTTWPFPTLAAIAEVPFLRPDGTVCLSPGYDPLTRLYYCPARDLVLPSIPSEPAPKDIEAALSIIEDGYDEFPFVDSASWANMLALLLTPIVRPMISGSVPIALIDKPAAGTGATLLADAATGLLGASTVRRVNESRDGDEWRKAITTALNHGATIIVMDNVEKSLGSPALAQAVTTNVWEDRALGTNEVIRVAVRVTWLATGNNLQVRGDMARRCYYIRLDAKRPRPWLQRKFRHPDLLAWVNENRGALIAALLTLARAWVAADMPEPKQVPKIGGFEGWCQTVGGILVHIGVNGFLGNLGDLYESVDDEDAPWGRFLEKWMQLAPEPQTAAALGKLIGENAELLAAAPPELQSIVSSNEPSLPAAIGRELRKRREKRFGERAVRVCSVLDRRTNTNLWVVRRDDQQAT